MRKTSLITFIVLSFIINPVLSQIQVTGKVVDTETQKAIPDATVRVINTTEETKTNYGGYFQLTMDTTNHLLIASPGYDSIQVKVLSERFKVSLTLAKKPVQKPMTEDEKKILFQNLLRSMEYPFAARRNKIQHHLYVSFTVDTQGNIINIKVLNDLNGLFEKSVLKSLTKLPRLSSSEFNRAFILQANYKLEGLSKVPTPENIQLPEGELLEEITLVGYDSVRKY